MSTQNVQRKKETSECSEHVGTSNMEPAPDFIDQKIQ